MERMSPLDAAKAVICAEAYWVPRSELTRIRVNSDYAEVGVKPRMRGFAHV